MATAKEILAGEKIDAYPKSYFNETFLDKFKLLGKRSGLI